jgi:hypothetical protein
MTDKEASQESDVAVLPRCTPIPEWLSLLALSRSNSTRIAPFVSMDQDLEQHQRNDEQPSCQSCAALPKLATYDCQTQQIRLEQASHLPVLLLLNLVLDAQRQRCFFQEVSIVSILAATQSPLITYVHLFIFLRDHTSAFVFPRSMYANTHQPDWCRDKPPAVKRAGSGCG